ncbi:hypothetical protein SASPL_116360 [Salvia splendens]|uniref:Remorin C-terminal domain-containing protein n=1 Tax=Salvia splendens TaxID=180675 RepID=A0A8X8ZWS8_SALSN|nr:uncharacterized protein LOC121809811 isoform X1 [Salvia splendens]KAG6419848.1 hypothetical protein SASPL_116360 [Salvia splendens]
MPELGFQDLRAGLRARDLSPDSVIFTGDTNFSLFSSASASVERCSFTSDVPDQESISSQMALSGPDPDPNKSIAVHRNSVSLSRKEKPKVQKVDGSEAETTEDENVALDSARNSFSQALKECQDRRLRSEVLLKKADRRRPASLDLNNAVTSTSPRLAVMKKPSAAARKTGTFPSPGTPNYRHTSVGVQKGWSSERVPPHTSANRRNVSTALLPYHNGRTLPSKWEDAERWIVSPVSGDGSMRASQQQAQRRPKSKSGPLGHPGVAYYQMFSPVTPMFEASRAEKLTANSPFSAGVMAVDGLSIRYGGGEGTGNFLNGTEPCMARSISIHGCSEMISQSALPGSQDAKYDATEDSANNISRAVSRRDMATQMSPESSNHSSPRRDSSFSLATPSILPVVEAQSIRPSRPEMRDVLVDERVTMTRWSRKSRGKNPGRSSRNGDDWKRKAANDHSDSWGVSSETSKSISKIQREEAKITAWENLQKAKAEAAIRKLEMKLEKKRSSSMDKIMTKLKSAQKKAQEMRGSVMASQTTTSQMARPSERALSFRRSRPISSLSGCFTCHAF